jgi:RNA polymerase sigma factor (sigma-70 family)
MVKYKENEIIAGLINEETDVIKFIYYKYFPAIQSLVNQYDGLKAQDKDIFQEGLTRAIINIRNGKFKGSSLFSTYLYSICQNICRKEIEIDKKENTLTDDFTAEEDDDEIFETYNRLLMLKNKLDKLCVEIIDLRMGLNSEKSNDGNKSLRFNEIAKLLNISHDNARQKFTRCLKKLKDFVMNDKILTGKL